MESLASYSLRGMAKRLVALVAAALCCSGTLQSESQNLEQALNAVVLIAGSRGEGTAVRGSGFVVALDRGMAIVVTSSHVIEGTKFEVTFGADPSRSFPVPPADVIKIETQNINGLAVFRVRGAIPAQVRPLELASGDGPAIGAILYLVGFPQMAATPRTVGRVFSGRDGQRLVFDQSVGEGLSGGPVILNDKVVGLVTDTDNQFTYGISFIVMREFLVGSGVKLAAVSAPSKPAGESSGPVTVAPPTPVGGASVIGTVTYDGKIPALKPLAMDSDPACATKHPAPVANEMLVLGNGNTMGNIMVWVSKGLPAGKSWPVPEAPVVLDQKGCLYKPHVMGIMVGQTYKILNSDGVLHNIQTLPRINAPFNKAMPATLNEATTVFDKPETFFRIRCDVHPWMEAYMAVFTHPFFSVTSRDGKFSIGGLNPGTYEITAWHERLPPQTAAVTVGANETKAQNFTLAVPSAK